MTGIYIITNKINNKSYIGQSPNIEERWIQHLENYRSGKYLQGAFKEYGIENFKLEILEECSYEDLKLRERYWIESLNTIYPNGYNGSNGGEGIKGFKICNNGILKISEYAKTRIGDKNSNYNNKWTNKQKQHLSKILKGHPGLCGSANGMYGMKGSLCPSYGKVWVNKDNKNFYILRENLDNYLLNGYNKGMIYKNTPSRFKNHKHSEESKEKISMSLKGRQVGKLNGMYGKIHSSEWKSEHSKRMSGINNPCYGKVAYNNGFITKFIKIKEIPYYESIGFIKGV